MWRRLPDNRAWRSRTLPGPGYWCPRSPRAGCGRACSGSRCGPFRTRKELLEAAYTAAWAELQVNEEIVDPAEAGSGGEHRGTGPVARCRPPRSERELGREPLPEGLLEPRPRAPGDSEIGLIFAVEPPGTAL